MGKRFYKTLSQFDSNLSHIADAFGTDIANIITERLHNGSENYWEYDHQLIHDLALIVRDWEERKNMKETNPTVSVLNKLTTLYVDMLDKTISFVNKAYDETWIFFHRELWQKSQKMLPILRKELYLFTSKNDNIYTWDKGNVITTYHWYNDTCNWEVVRKHVMDSVPKNWEEARSAARGWHEYVYPGQS
jgi:hypothetical protein